MTCDINNTQDYVFVPADNFLQSRSDVQKLFVTVYCNARVLISALQRFASMGFRLTILRDFHFKGFINIGYYIQFTYFTHLYCIELLFFFLPQHAYSLTVEFKRVKRCRWIVQTDLHLSCNKLNSFL